MAPISDIERQVYSNIYERYSQKLLGICLGYVHDIDVAKDILHDAFIIIFSRIGTLREPEKIEQWMCAIARNLSLKHIEKEKKFSGTDVSELNEIHEEEAAATGIEAIPFEDLIKAIDELPTQYGKVFRLSVLEGLSHQEIGEMLGIAPHSSSSNLARAKQLLRKIINRNWGILITFLVLLFAIFHFTGREDIAVEYEEELISVIEEPVAADSTVEIEKPLIAMAEPAENIAKPAENIAEPVEKEDEQPVQEMQDIVEVIENEEADDIQEDTDCIDPYDTDVFEDNGSERRRGRKVSLSFSVGSHGPAGNDGETQVGNGHFPSSPPDEGMPTDPPSGPGTGNDDFGNIEDGENDDEEKDSPMKRRIAAGQSSDDSRYRHYMPVSFDASLNWEVSGRWNIGTGLRYTYLRSDIMHDQYVGKQKIHYLGIPLKASYTFWDCRFINAYVSAGALFEMPLAAQIDGRQIDAPYQWSAGAGIGMQFEITRKLSIYVEPDLYYYFDTGSDIRTIRTDKPFSFTIPVGIRFTWQ
ncbi:MAG: sigma-70 family RNA polymerase sigma factor [Bacteroidales bacterium]|nr:sigma-70 family RNA polymerase sigma factor [Bacteroidales bacterium]